jgi:hypothetical protein
VLAIGFGNTCNNWPITWVWHERTLFNLFPLFEIISMMKSEITLPLVIPRHWNNTSVQLVQTVLIQLFLAQLTGGRQQVSAGWIYGGGTVGGYLRGGCAGHTQVRHVRRASLMAVWVCVDSFINHHIPCLNISIQPGAQWATSRLPSLYKPLVASCTVDFF